MILGKLFINAQEAKITRIKDFRNEKGDATSQFIETLPGGAQHAILEETDYSYYDNTPVYVVPANHYFVMGDNRDHSNDSRGSIGFVPYENITGKVETIFFSSPDIKWYNPIFLLSLRKDRFFKECSRFHGQGSLTKFIHRLS